VLITGLVTGWWPDRIVEPALQLAFGIAFVVVIATLGSVFLSTIANGVAVLMIFGAGLTAGLLQQIGEALRSESLQDVGRVAANLLPFEALYQGALQALTADVFGITGFAVRLGPFGGGQPLDAGLYAWFAIYFALLLGGCIALFERRDI
jgi:ABC-2 type transport system permease protein